MGRTRVGDNPDAVAVGRERTDDDIGVVAMGCTRADNNFDAIAMDRERACGSVCLATVGRAWVDISKHRAMRMVGSRVGNLVM